MSEVEYLWDHWKFNADQRLKAFNFFVVFSVFANGGLFTAIEKCAHPIAVVVIGLFIFLLAAVFWLMDARSRQLLGLTLTGLKRYESPLNDDAKLFHNDERHTQGLVRYTVAFRVLFLAQLTLGALVMFYALASSWPSLKAAMHLPVIMQCKA